MKKETLSILACLTLAAFMSHPGRAQSPTGPADPASADAHIKNITAITRVYPDGLKVAAVAIEYDKTIRGSSVSPSAYVVKTDVPSQKVIGAYTSTDGDYFTRTGQAGPFVVLELSTDFILPVNVRTDNPTPRPPGAGNAPPPSVTHEPAKLPPNPEVVIKFGNISWEPAAHPSTLLPAGKGGGSGKVVSVTQVASIAAADGAAIAPDAGAKDSNLIRNMTIDGFMKPDYRDPANGNVKYSIHFPRDYDANKKYPLIVFLTDQNDAGSVHADALTHANGGVVWAEKDEEARHEAIVAVPLPMHILVNDKYEAAPETHFGPPPAPGAALAQATPSPTTSIPYLANLGFVDYLIANIPNIDKNRIYLTGQGDGARAGIKMMIDRPDLFAAALLFAPDYDPAQMAKLAKANLWIVASEADGPSYANMQSAMDSLKAAGARIGKAEWNGQADQKELAADVNRLSKDDNNIRFVAFKNGTTLPASVAGNALNDHAYTWRIGYSIQSLRDWLFTQKK